MLDASGAPIGVQQRLMRHAQVSTTMNVYGSAYMEGKREAHSKVVQMVLPQSKRKGCRSSGSLLTLMSTRVLIVGLCGLEIR
jgi:hypothetical protein